MRTLSTAAPVQNEQVVAREGFGRPLSATPRFCTRAAHSAIPPPHTHTPPPPPCPPSPAKHHITKHTLLTLHSQQKQQHQHNTTIKPTQHNTTQQHNSSSTLQHTNIDNVCFLVSLGAYLWDSDRSRNVSSADGANSPPPRFCHRSDVVPLRCVCVPCCIAHSLYCAVRLKS